MKNLYNINFDIAALLISIVLVLILKFQYVKSSDNNIKFRRCVLLVLISGALDLITALTLSNADVVPVALNTFLNSLYLLASVAAGMFTERYVASFVKAQKKIHLILDFIIAGVYAALLIINCFTGLIFDFKGGTYNKGPFLILNFIFPLLYLFHITYYLIRRHKSFSRKQLFMSSTTVLFPIINSAIQIMMPEYLLTFFGEAMFCLILLFTTETPDFIELEYLRKNLELEVEKATATARERQLKIQKMATDTIEALAQAIDEKDDYTNGHSKRVSNYSVLLAYALNWTTAEIEDLKSAALLHDIGKIGIPDSVLQKPAKLDDNEYKIIQQHTIKGGNILHNVTSLPNAEIAARYHHERFDGTGYPEGISGKNIPAFARVVAIADAYDAMSTRRVYRDPLPADVIRQRLIEGSGTQFDPDYLQVFITLLDQGLIINQ